MSNVIRFTVNTHPALDAMQREIEAAIDNYRGQTSYAEVIGVLEIVKLNMQMEMTR